jgi:hypothetical protein
LIEDLEFHIARCLEIVIGMNVVALDVPNNWGMLLSRKWATTLGGNLQMDLPYATIPIGDESHDILYNQPKKRTHVEDLESDSKSNISLEEDRSKEPIDPPTDFDLYDLPFSQEEDIKDIIWHIREDYQRELDKYNDKDLSSITISKKGGETKLHKDDQKNITFIRSHYLSLKKIKYTQ